MSSVVWCDDLGAPTMGIVDRDWIGHQPYQIVSWLDAHGGSGSPEYGIIFVPNEEIKMLFILRWL